jgi:hypothetical protein
MAEFTYPQITIGGTSYPAYVSVADADTYMNGSVNSAAWSGLSADDKGRAIVSAVRVIDAQKWMGTKTDPDNALEWPRTCQADPSVLPPALISVTINLAFAVSQNAELVSGASVGQGATRSLKAGSVAIEYFNTGISPAQSNASTIFGYLGPLADCLANGGGSGSIMGAGAYSSGTDRPSVFSDPDFSLARGI